MNFQRLLNELDAAPEDCAEQVAASVVNQISEWATQNGYPTLVRAWVPAAQVIEVRKYIAACVAAIKPLVDAPATLTPPQVAKQLGASRDSVLAWIRSGQLRASNLAKGHRPRYVIAPDDLAAFLEKRQPEPPQPRPKKRHPTTPKRY